LSSIRQTVKKYIGILLNITIPIIITVLVCYFGPKLIAFFMPFVIGGIIAAIAGPLVKFLETKLKIVRQAGSFAVIVLVLAFIVLCIYGLGSWAFHTIANFMTDLPQLYKSFSGDMQVTLDNLQEMSNRLPEGMRIQVDTFLTDLGENIGSFAPLVTNPTMEAAGSVAKSIPNALIYTIVTIMAAYFMLADYENIQEYFHKIMPKFAGNVLSTMKTQTLRVVVGYVLAQLKIMAVITLILAVGFLILGVSYSLLLAIFISIIDFLPILGTGTIMIPWAIIKIINGNYGMAIGLLIVYAITQIVRQLIQPKLLGDSMGLNPMLTLVLLFIGFKVKGIGGMILAVPVGIVFIEICKLGAYQSVIDGCKELYDCIQELRNTKKDKKQN
jgi:sporulation integral membrane protein YtvI